MIILRVAQQEREWAETAADIAQRERRRLASALAQMHPVHLHALPDDFIGEAELPIEFEVARVHDHRARSLRRPRVAVDDPYGHPAPRQ